MEVPTQYREYDCAEYFADGWAERGHFDERSQTWVIAPLAETYEGHSIGFFAVGRSGWGGIDFGYRRGFAGLWAFYPIDREFRLMAATVAELVEGWCSDRLAV